MGILDVPKGLISRLPLIGGSGESKDDAEKPNDPVDEAPEIKDEPDEPDEPDTVDETDDEPDADEDEVDETEEVEDEPDDEPDSKDDQPDSDPDGSGREAEQPSGDGSVDISDTTAPSIGPNTVIEKDTPEERLARHEQSDKDAMGLDKRREVVGGSYSASFGKQLIRWALVVVVIAGLAFGAKLLVDDIDQPPEKVEKQAPWSGTEEPPAALE